MNPRNIAPAYYTVVNNPYEVRDLLIKEGFNEDYMRSVEDLYKVCLEYIKQDGEKAIDNLANLHPDLQWILAKFCNKKDSRAEKQSSYLTDNLKPSLVRFLSDSELKQRLLHYDEKLLTEKDSETREAIQSKIDELTQELGIRNTNGSKSSFGNFKFEIMLAVVIIFIIVLILK